MKFQTLIKKKDLRILTDQNLSFESHITSIINIANNRNLGIVRRTFTYLDKEIFLHLYKSLVRPQLEFASSVYSPHLKKHKIILENVQRRATKLMPAISHLSYEERSIYLGLPSLEYRRPRADMIQVYKILHSQDKTTNTKLLELSNYNRTRGNNIKLFKKSSKTEIYGILFPPHPLFDLRGTRKVEIRHTNFHFSSKKVTSKSRKVEVFDLTIVKKLSTFRPRLSRKVEIRRDQKK